MPQITVDYSASVSEAFDRRTFAVALHQTLSPLVSSDVAAFKTRFSQIDEHVIGDGESQQAMIHIRVGLLAGRPVGAQAGRSARRAIELAHQHLKPVEGLTTQLTLEVYDMDREQYQKRVI